MTDGPRALAPAPPPSKSWPQHPAHETPHKHSLPTARHKASPAQLPPPEKLSLHVCAMVCSSSTAWPQPALISSHSTGHSGVRPSRKPLMVPKGPSCQILRSRRGGDRPQAG
eukprot:GHRQ01024884.1.p3 GENE.GHRQ01024884.1~~GHRQ01024884.1.p3  ORF type:complete len:112 (+),score=8.41 GHRQ01024884.1:307-642(+)